MTAKDDREYGENARREILAELDLPDEKQSDAYLMQLAAAYIRLARRGFLNWGSWYTCLKCGNINMRGYICATCGHDPTFNDELEQKHEG